MAKASSRLGRGLGSLIAGGTAAKVEDVSSSNPTLSPISTQKESIRNSSDIVDSDSTNDSDEENLFSIPIDSIVPNPYQPRKVIDPDAIRELASSIESEGLLQPITARKVGDSYELVAGERRWRAHQSLGEVQSLYGFSRQPIFPPLLYL